MTDLTWDQWKIARSTTSGSEGLVLNVQGASLHDILALVRAEIDKLKRGDAKAAIAALSNRFDDEKEKHKQDMVRMNDKIDRLGRKVMENGPNDAMEEKLKKAMDRIRELEEVVHTKITPPVQEAFTNLESRVQALEEKLLEHDNNSSSKGVELPDDLMNRIEGMESKTEKVSEKCINLADRVRQVEDSTFALSSQQGKIIGDIAKLATSNEATQRNLDNVENMTDRHTEDIKDLMANKADLSDLNEKFRALGGVVSASPANASSTGGDGVNGASGRRPSSARVRGNMSGDENLTDMVHELDRQLKMLSVATTEGLNGVQKKTDKKIEFMTNWIIKYLKNLLKGESGMDGDKETDIGKVQMAVKCLVCNKPAKQNDNDGATPHPNFRTTFGVKKERRLKTDSSGNRLDTGMRGAYNETDDWRVQRSNSPPRNSDSPPTVERPKSAGPKHVKAIQLADSFENVANSQYEPVGSITHSQTYGNDEDKSEFHNAMDK